MKSGVPVLFGVFLVLATSLLTGSAVGERHTRRITSSDLPPTSNSTKKNTIATSAPNCSNGSCSAALQEEGQGKAKVELPDVSPDDSSHVVEPSTHEGAQERLHADLVRHLTSTTHHSSYEGPYYQNGHTVDTESSAAEKNAGTFHDHEYVGAEVKLYNASLTTPRIGLFDDRFTRISEGIQQNLEDLEEQHAFRGTSTTEAPHQESTARVEAKSIPPTTADLTHRNGSKVALEYTNHVSIQYNDTSDPPRSIRKDIVVENGTHIDYSSTYIHTEEFPEHTPEVPVTRRRGESNAHSNGHNPPSEDDDSADQSAGGASAVDTVDPSGVDSEETGPRNISSQLSTGPQQTTSNFRVTPGEIHSTTFKSATSKSSSRSQQYDITTEDDSANSSSENSTVTPQSNKTRYSRKRIQISGIPTTAASPIKLFGSSSPRTRFKTYTRRPISSTTSETESSTLPVNSSLPKTRGRMYTLRRNRVNDTNSLQSSATLVPISSSSEVLNKNQAGREPSTQAAVSSVTFDEEVGDQVTMVRMNVSTVRPSSSTTLSIPRIGAHGTSTTDRNRNGVWLTTQPTHSNTVQRKVLSLKRRPDSAEVTDQTTMASVVRETTVFMNENVIQVRPSEPKSQQSAPSSAVPNTEGNDIVTRSPARPIWSRGSVRYGNVTKGLSIPPTAAAWALASLRSPGEGNRITRRPADNETNATVTTEASDEETGAPETTTSSIPTVALEAMEGLVAMEISTTPSKSVREPSLISLLTTPLPDKMDSQTSAPLASASASMQENRISTVQVQPPGLETSTTRNIDLSTTTEIIPITEDSTMGTTISTTDHPFSKEDEDLATILPIVTSPPESVTEAMTDTTTTEIIPQTSTVMNSVQDGTTTALPPATTAPEMTTTASPPQETSTVSVVVDNKEMDDSDVATSTEPPTTSTEAVGPGLALPEMEDDVPSHPAEAGESGSRNEEHDYHVETEAPLPARPSTAGVNSYDEDKDSAVTTDNPEQTSFIEEVDENTLQPLEVGGTDMESTTTKPELLPLPAPSEVTAYLRVTVQASWSQLCTELEEFHVALANMLVADTGRRNLTTRNVVLVNVGKEECSQVVSSAEMDGSQQVVINMYLLDERGGFDKELTEEFPMLWSGTNQPFPLEIKQVDLMTGQLPSTSDSSNAGVIAAITISCVGALCLLLLAGLLIVMRKRQKRFNYGQRCTPVSLDAYSLDSVSVYNSVRRKGGFRASKRSYGNPAFDDPGAPSHPMNFAGLANFSSDRVALEEEFTMVPQIIPKADELPEGAETKNRYSNVIPLPETRVPLAIVEGEPLSDYINANFVKGPKNESKFYIACQAPMPSTVTDFWRMMWEQQSKVILMLTDLVENGVEKCADYLPPSEVLDCHRLFGDYQITLKKREEREKYVISTLQLKNLETNTWREVTHLWYLSWPHQGVPDEANSIIAFLIEARTYMRANQGPNVIHCSPGTGRTGTVLACDICIREFEQTRMVDIPRCVYRLRRDRGGAVKTRDQYVFIYQVLNTYATKLTGGGLDSI